MIAKKLGNKHIIRINKGQDIISELEKYCRKKKIYAGTISGIGAANDIEIGLFDTQKKEYFSKKFKGDYEICSLAGNISTMNNQIYLHLHSIIADKNQKTFGGHLNSAIVSATFEAIIDVFDGKIEREFNDEVGLNLLKFEE